jgi:hypothetical protein
MNGWHRISPAGTSIVRNNPYYVKQPGASYIHDHDRGHPFVAEDEVQRSEHGTGHTPKSRAHRKRQQLDVARIGEVLSAKGVREPVPGIGARRGAMSRIVAWGSGNPVGADQAGKSRPASGKLAIAHTVVLKPRNEYDNGSHTHDQCSNCHVIRLEPGKQYNDSRTQEGPSKSKTEPGLAPK